MSDYDPSISPRWIGAEEEPDTSEAERTQLIERLVSEQLDVRALIEMMRTPGWTLLEQTLARYEQDLVRYLTVAKETDILKIAEHRAELRTFRWFTSLLNRAVENESKLVLAIAEAEERTDDLAG